LGDFFIMGGPEWYQHVNVDDESIMYKDTAISFFAGWFPPKWVSIRSRTFIGKQEDKDTFYIGPEISVSPFEKLNMEVELQRLDKEGERLVINRRVSARYQFTHQMFFNTSFGITRDNQRNVFALFGWEYIPECHFFLVYTGSKDNEEIDRIMFVKLSYLLKLNVF